MSRIPSRSVISIFMCGDVMTGRGIDQVLPCPGDPHIHEPYVRDARRYVELAEINHGPIPRPVSFAHIWGVALGILQRMTPDVRVINLETSVTSSDDYWRGKGINYRMHPGSLSERTSLRLPSPTPRFASSCRNRVQKNLDFSIGIVYLYL